MTRQNLAKWHLPLVLGALGLVAAWWPIVQPLPYDDGGFGGIQILLSGTVGWSFGVADHLIEPLLVPRWVQYVMASALGFLPFLVVELALARWARRSEAGAASGQAASLG